MDRLERRVGTEQGAQPWRDDDVSTGQPLPEVQGSCMGTQVKLVESYRTEEGDVD